LRGIVVESLQASDRIGDEGEERGWEKLLPTTCC
jgi:hypothetical protein